MKTEKYDLELNKIIIKNHYDSDKYNEKKESLNAITSCSVDELNTTNESLLDEFIEDTLFESDHWDDNLPEENDDHSDKKRIWNDNLEKSCGKCNYVENELEFSNMIKCEGYCRRPYHLKCVGLNSIPLERWKCEYCIKDLVYCNYCNKFSNKVNIGFLKCCHPLCMRFFHTCCLFNNKNSNSEIIWTYKNNSSCGYNNLMVDGNACMHSNNIFVGNIPIELFNEKNNNINEIIFTRRLLKDYQFKFICNRHFCSTCDRITTEHNSRKANKNLIKNIRKDNKLHVKRYSIKLENPEELFYCIRCNTGYHERCLHPDSIKITNGICICYKHIHDENILVEKFDIKGKLKQDECDEILNNLNKKEDIKLDKKIDLFNIIRDYIKSSDYEIKPYPFELPGQSKDWKYNDLKDYIRESYRDDNKFGYINIRKNIYVEDNDYSDSTNDFCRNNHGKNLNKKKLFLNNKKQTVNEKCSCKIICEKDTCQNAAMYIECNSLICGLKEEIQSLNCMNRMFNSSINKSLDNQKKNILKNLRIFDAGKKGLGVYCNILIPKDTFIIEYVGEVLTKSNYLKRVEKYKKKEVESRKNYLQDLDDEKICDQESENVNNLNYEKERHWYFMEIGSDYVIDSTIKGNISRLINHSCEPNCVAQKWIVGNECRIGIFSLKDIKPNEELTYDYSFNAYDIGFKCKCNTKSCKGRIGIENFKESNDELIKKRNNLCSSTNFFNNFTTLNKSLLNNPLLIELNRLFLTNEDYNRDYDILYKKIEKLDNFFENNEIKTLLEYNKLLNKHIIENIEIYPYDFKYRNSLYGYTCLLFFDSPNIIDWYFKKSRNLLLMQKPWIILPFMFNNFEHKILDNKIMNIQFLKKYICRRISIYIDKNIKNLSNNSLFWYLFDTGIGSDECCNICKNPGTLITCDFCYYSFHKYCLYNSEIPNNLKRSRLSYNYKEPQKIIIQCKKCSESNLYSVYWTQIPHKERKKNFFLKQKIFSLPLFMNRL